MAEGGKPAESETDTLSDDLKVEIIDSLEMLFARDFIAYVMKRRIPNWTGGGYYAQKCNVTSFSYRIRKAVDFYLNKECINLDTLFHMAFMEEHMNYASFVSVMDLFVGDRFPMVDTYNDLLRFLCQYAHFTAMASKWGIHTAPFYALLSMEDLIRDYFEKKDITTECFFGELGFEAVNLMYENKKIVIHPFE